MLWVYVPRDSSLERVPVASKQDVPDSSVWFDLVNPKAAPGRFESGDSQTAMNG